MKKLMDKIKKNNKGFTLVELIVVVAVLAIITVVAAPQYIKYVEKSRVGTDENAIGEIAHIAEISWVEMQSKDVTKTDNNVKFTAKTTGIAYGELTGELDALVAQIVPEAQYKFKSEQYTKTTPSITITVTNGVATWTAAAAAK